MLIGSVCFQHCRSMEPHGKSGSVEDAEGDPSKGDAGSNSPRVSSSGTNDSAESTPSLPWQSIFYPLPGYDRNAQRVSKANTAAAVLTEKINNRLKLFGIRVKDMPYDGNCMMCALSHQLTGTIDNHLVFRKEVCDYMLRNRAVFEPFVEFDRNSPFGYEHFIRSLGKAGTVLGQEALAAFANLKSVAITVHQLGRPSIQFGESASGSSSGLSDQENSEGLENEENNGSPSKMAKGTRKRETLISNESEYVVENMGLASRTNDQSGGEHVVRKRGFRKPKHLHVLLHNAHYYSVENVHQMGVWSLDAARFAAW